MISSRAALLKSSLVMGTGYFDKRVNKKMMLLWYRDVVILFILGKSEEYSQYSLMSFQKIELKLFTLILCFKGLRDYLAKFKPLSREIF